MIDEVHILKHCKSCYFGCCPGKKPGWLLCVISNHHELVIELRKEGLDSFSEFFVSPCWRSPILLIQSIGHFQCDVCHIEKVLLYLSTEVAFVPKHHTIVVFPSHIVKVVEVVNAGCSYIIRMDDPTYPTDCVELIAVIIDSLRCAVAPLRSAFVIAFAHSATFGSSILTHLDWFGVNAEDILIAIHCHGYVLADFLTKHGCELAAPVILAPGNQIWQALTFFGIKTLEEVILAIKAKRLGCGRECYNFEVGEFGFGAAMWAISVFVYAICGEFLVYVKNLCEFCDEVVHMRDISNQ